MKKFIFLVGARPQIIKFAALFPEIKKSKIEFILVHSGQHYDKPLSEVFFNELKLPLPHYNLKVGSGTHAKQTADIMIALEKVLHKEKPDFGILFGDTNTTLAGSLLFSQKNMPFAHIEAGVRSYRKDMPEEINRIITDRLSTILFAPSRLAVENLKKEGITKNVYNVGDLHYDIFKSAIQKVSHLSVLEKDFVFLTVHREENTKTPDFIRGLLKALDREKIKCVFPAHPRTLKLTSDLELEHVKLIEPISYLTTLRYIKNAKIIITDSGGLQKEAFFMKKRVIILRKETEWREIVESGYAKLVGNDVDAIIRLIKTPWKPHQYSNYYGDGNAAQKIIEVLKAL